jgi:hypothetical protein
VLLETAVGTSKPGVSQRAQFYSGVFTLTQPGERRLPITEATLKGALECQTSRGKLQPARSRSRRLWGNGKGRYRTRGRHSSATVRGTIWLTKDSCTTTTTTVREGTVDVKDFAKHRNVRVRAGQRYVARARKR